MPWLTKTDPLLDLSGIKPLYKLGVFVLTLWMKEVVSVIKQKLLFISNVNVGLITSSIYSTFPVYCGLRS